MQKRGCFNGTNIRLQTALAWMMRDPRWEAPGAPVGHLPPQPSLNYWMDSENAGLEEMPEKTPGAPSPCRCIQQPQPRLSGEEPPPSLWLQRTSRNLGRAPASSNRPRRSCLAPPAFAPSATLKHPPLPVHPEPNCPASARVTPCPRFPRCLASPPWRPRSLRAIGHPPRSFQRRNQSSLFSLEHLSNAPLKCQESAFWVVLLQKTGRKPLWDQNPWFSKAVAWLETTGWMTRPRTSCPPSEEPSRPAVWRARCAEAGGHWASTSASCLLRPAAGEALKRSHPARVGPEEVPKAGDRGVSWRGLKERGWRRRAARGETWPQSWKSTWKRSWTDPGEESKPGWLDLIPNQPPSEWPKSCRPQATTISLNLLLNSVTMGIFLMRLELNILTPTDDAEVSVFLVRPPMRWSRQWLCVMKTCLDV